jgi:O-antigen/teichoic acid export membrane protein
MSVRPEPEATDLPAGDPGGRSGWAGSLASGSARLFAAQVAGHAGFFVAVLVMTRALSPADRGRVAFVVVSALIAARVALFGLADATMVFAAARPDSRRQLLSNAALATTASSLVVATITAAVLEALGLQRLTILQLVFLGLAALGTNVTETGRCFLLGCGDFRPAALVLAIWPWGYAGLLLLVAATRDLTVTGTVAGWAFANAAAAAALMFVAARRHGVARPDAALFRTTLAFGVRAWAISASRFLNFRVDQVLLGLLASAAALGTYAVAVNASETLLYLPFALGAAIVPVIGGSEESQRGERALKALRALLLATAPAVAVAALVGPPLLPLVFGHAYEGSVTPFVLLLPGAFGFSVISVLESALVAAQRPILASVGFVTAFAIGVILDLVLIPPYQADGAAAAGSLALLAGAYASFVCFRRVFPARWRSLLPGLDDLRSIVLLARATVARI